MRKKDEISNPNSCLNKAEDDEFVFVLLARDQAASVAIRAWIDERIRLGVNNCKDGKLSEADFAAEFMKDQGKRIRSRQ